METKDKVITGLVILIISVVYLNVITGRVIEVSKNRDCMDIDGKNYLIKGETQSRGNVETKQRVDACHTSTEAIEYYCDDNNLVKSEIINCASIGKTECQLGRCI